MHGNVEQLFVRPPKAIKAKNPSNAKRDAPSTWDTKNIYLISVYGLIG